VVIGAVVSFIHRWFYLVILFPALLGVGVGLAGRQGLKLGKVRNSVVAGGLGVVAGVLVMLVSYYGGYLLTLREVNKEVPGGRAQEMGFTFPNYMDALATDGVQIGRPGRGQGMNLGYAGSYLYWGAEMVFAAGAAFFMIRKSTDDPFCLTCHMWKSGQVLGTMTVRQDTIREIMNDGDLPRLGQLYNEGGTVGTDVHFMAYPCPECAEQSTVEIRVYEIRLDNKGRPQEHDIGTWSFTAEALSAWKHVFVAPAT
jgi:hypothetical protein